MAKTTFVPHGNPRNAPYRVTGDMLRTPVVGPASLPPAPRSGNRLIATFQALGWDVAPDALAGSMGSAMLALASFAIAGATWRVRIGQRITHLERRAHGTPTGRASCGHWESVGTLKSPTTDKRWRKLAETLTETAIGFESALQPAGYGTPSASQHSEPNRARIAARIADGSEIGHAAAGRGKVGKSNPTRLSEWGFRPASGWALLDRLCRIDASPTVSMAEHRIRIGFDADPAVVDARKARRNARRKRQRAPRVTFEAPAPIVRCAARMEPLTPQRMAETRAADLAVKARARARYYAVTSEVRRALWLADGGTK